MLQGTAEIVLHSLSCWRFFANSMFTKHKLASLFSGLNTTLQTKVIKEDEELPETMEEIIQQENKEVNISKLSQEKIHVKRLRGRRI